MMNRKIWLWIILYLFSLLLPWLVYAADQENQTQEITVVGVTLIGQDQESIYRNAINNAFQKAVDIVRPTKNLSPDDVANNTALKKDLILAQRELGIIDYKVLRYWREQDNFYIEMKIIFGELKVDQRLPEVYFLPKMSWVYQTDDQIVSIGNSGEMLTICTAQTIQVLASDKGKRSQWIKTGLSSHSIRGDNYLIEDGDYLKLASLKKFNVYNLLNYSVVYQWRKKIPDPFRFYLSDQSAYLIERTGLVKAFALEDGKEKWSLQVNSQVNLDQLDSKHLLISPLQNELWMVNEKGIKLWVKKFALKLAAKPISVDNELICLFSDGQFMIFNLDTGRIVNTWTVKLKNPGQNINLVEKDQKLFLLYNDLDYKGHLQVYQKYTGSMLWEVTWEGTAGNSMVVLPNLIIVGIKNTLEARDLLFGLKKWDEPISGRINQIGWINDKLLVVAGDRLYGYDLK